MPFTVVTSSTSARTFPAHIGRRSRTFRALSGERDDVGRDGGAREDGGARQRSLPNAVAATTSQVAPAAAAASATTGA